jgi:hypothetical protein
MASTMSLAILVSSRKPLIPDSTVFGADKVVVFDTKHPHTILQMISTNPGGGTATHRSASTTPLDQCTLFYTSEGRLVKRFDVCANTQLTDFATLPNDGYAYALRLLPPVDGTRGLLVADNSDIKRLNGIGNVVLTYDIPGKDNWFSLNLDPDGTSFWSGDSTTREFYRFEIA